MDHFHDNLAGDLSPAASAKGDEAMYQEIILDHYRVPRNAGTLAEYDVKHRELNQSCGDVIEMYLRIEDGKVADVRFDGTGCAISMASVSLLTEHAKGKPLAELSAMGMEDMFKVLGVRVGPTRIKCALLGLKTLQAAIAEASER